MSSGGEIGFPPTSLSGRRSAAAPGLSPAKGVGRSGSRDGGIAPPHHERRALSGRAVRPCRFAGRRTRPTAPAFFNASAAAASTSLPRSGQRSEIAPLLPEDAWPCPGCAPPGRGVPGLPSVQPQNLSTSHPYWSLFTTKPVQIEMRATNCRRSCTRLSNARCLQRCQPHHVFYASNSDGSWRGIPIVCSLQCRSDQVMPLNLQGEASRTGTIAGTGPLPPGFDPHYSRRR